MESEKEDIDFIESTLIKEGSYDAFYTAAFNTDVECRIGFMSLSNYNELGLHKPISLKANEYYEAAENGGVNADNGWKCEKRRELLDLGDRS